MKINEIRKLISLIKDNLNRSYWFYPYNFKEEKKKFFSGKNHSPVFVYPKMPIKKLKEFLKIIRKVQFENENDSKLELARMDVEEVRLRLELVISVCEQKITEKSAELYRCSLSSKYFAKAEEDAEIETDHNLKSVYVDKNILQKVVEKYLSDLSLNDWKIKECNNNDFIMKIRPNLKEILFPKNRKIIESDLDYYIAHEIDGHLIRAINMMKYPDKIFARQLPFYLKTEEGLASFLGDFCSQSSKQNLKRHAINYLAGKIAIKKSFRDVFNFLVEKGYSKERAFRGSYRLKKGLKDTSLPGCFARQMIYYEGMCDVKDFIDNGGNIKKLYATKAGLQELFLIKNYQSVIIPQRLVSYVEKMGEMIDD